MKSSILLVDDNEIQAATRTLILERSGHSVVVAPHGVQALRMLSDPEISQSIGLLVTDHLMPGMNGPQLVSEVRRLNYQIPILVLSGLPDAEPAYEGLHVIFRLKPFAPDELVQLTRSLLSPAMSRTA